MARPARSPADLLVLPVVLVAAAATWLMHAQSWDLGARSPILNYDTAQYALAARELAWHGRLATPFALPVELASQARPPWPLAVLQPGLVLIEAAIFRLVPARGAVGGSDPRAWLTLVVPFCCFLFLAAAFALAMQYLLRRWWPEGPAPAARAVSLVAGLMLALDPEAQHFAIGGFTELPFTIGLLFALLGLALEAPGRSPLAFGLVLGLSGLFRANMLWLAPVFALAGAWSAPEGRRVRTPAIVLLGFVIPLAPWWFYKWRVFGDPGWDLTRYVVWDHVGGRTWFSLYHLPELPSVPSGGEAVRLLAAKVFANLQPLALAMLTGPRGLWLGGLVIWCLARPRPRPLLAAALALIVAAALGVASAAVSIPWLRYLFPTRILLEPAGALALAALVWERPEASFPRRAKVLASAGIAVIAIGWGALSTVRGNAEARASSWERGVPASSTITALSVVLSERLTPGEPIMSNLGPALAWQTNHPVVHLALTPDDVEACRRRLDFHHVILVFRSGERAWAGWDEIVEREGEAATHPRLGAVHERRYQSKDGFVVVWLELGPLPGAMAANAGR